MTAKCAPAKDPIRLSNSVLTSRIFWRSCAYQGVAYIHTLVKMMVVYVVESTALRSAESAASGKPSAAFCAADLLPPANAPLSYLALAPPSFWAAHPKLNRPFSAPAATDKAPGASGPEWTPTPLPPHLPNVHWAHASDALGLAALATPGKVGARRRRYRQVLVTQAERRTTIQAVGSRCAAQMLLIATKGEIGVVFKYVRPKGTPLSALPTLAWRPYWQDDGQSGLRC